MDNLSGLGSQMHRCIRKRENVHVRICVQVRSTGTHYRTRALRGTSTFVLGEVPQVHEFHTLSGAKP
jgi:hypothetical protein